MREGPEEGEAAPSAPERVLGALRGEAAGPTLVAVAGIHGNEPAGVLAARRVLARLAELGPPLAGELVVLAGNRRALAAGRRFIDRDLNRLWTDERVAELRGGEGAEGAGGAGGELAEDGEQRELLHALDAALARARGPVHFLDLHTTSADGFPFALVLDGAQGSEFARHFPLPGIRGLLRHIGGVLLDHMHRRGCVTLGVEGGQNLRPSSVEHHESVLWIALWAAGLLPRAALPGLELHVERLERARGELPRQLEVLARYAIAPEDGFRMEPGFANIHPVRRGQLLARDRRGEVRAPLDGWILMPLYQGQGEEGFFLAREVD